MKKYYVFKILGEEEAANEGMPRWDDLNQEEIQQLVEEVQDVAEHVDTMNVSLENAVKQLRAAADFLDQMWKDCKIASAVGSGANITGGLLAVLGGVATIMTAGVATPLLIAGTALGVAGTCTTLGTSAVEASANQSVIQEAEVAVQNANRAIETVRKRISMLKTGKSQVRLVFLAGLAIRMLGKNHLVVSFMKDLLRTDLLTKVLPSMMDALRAVPGLAARAGVEGVTSAVSKGLIEASPKEALSIGVNVGARNFSRTGAELGERAVRRVGATIATKGAGKAGRVGAKIATKGAGKAGTKVGARAAGKAGTKAVSKGAGKSVAKGGTKAVGKAGAKTGAKAAGGFIIGVSAAFLVLDAIDLAFAVRDIVKDEGSDEARCLRCKADEYEAILLNQ